MNLKTLVTFMGVTLGILVGVGALLWQFGTNTGKPLEDVAGEMRLKKGEGAVTVVVFSDFQCPACASVATPLKEVMAKFEGKATLVHRHFPLASIHKNAIVAAQATEAAYKQGKFWEYGESLYTKQNEWAGLSEPKAKLIEYAIQLGMDAAKFAADMESEEARERVNTDLIYANRHALTGTPSFFVNGRQVDFANLETQLNEVVQ